jgi:hypothetical protein
MKRIIIFLIINISLLLAKTPVNLDENKISHFQVLSMELVDRSLYIATYFDGNTALDRYDIDDNIVERNVLEKNDANISFGNSNLFCDSKNNLWIGDLNKMFKLEPDGNLVKFFENYEAPDSTYFEIKSFSEDSEGNIIIAKSNSKIIKMGESNGTGWSFVDSDLDLLKYENGNLELLHNFPEIEFKDNKILCHENKVYIPSLFEENIAVFDLNSNTYEDLIADSLEFPRFEWEKVKNINFEDVILFNNDIYLVGHLHGQLGNARSFIKINDDNSFETFTLTRNEEDYMRNFQSFDITDSLIICSELTNSYDERSFLIFDGNDFFPIKANIDSNSLVTSKQFTPFALNNDLSLEDIRFRFSNGLVLDDNTLYAGTNAGLIKINNFLAKEEDKDSVELNIEKIQSNINYSVKSNYLEVNSLNNINSIRIINLKGEIIYENYNLQSKDAKVNLNGIPRSLYLVEINDNSGNYIIKINN